MILIVTHIFVQILLGTRTKGIKENRKSWERPFHPVEVVIHRKYKPGRRGRGTKNDIALIRIDYPLFDKKSGKHLFLQKESSSFCTGMTVMSVNNFGKRRLMPICLPSSSFFRDTIRGN